MVSQEGVEPSAFRLGGEPSIQLRYWRQMKKYEVFTGKKNKKHPIYNIQYIKQKVNQKITVFNKEM